MASDIEKNFVYLTENLTNLQKLLIHLVQNKIISLDEKERIAKGETSLDCNDRLWTLLDKKDWTKNKKLIIEILRRTGSEHCVEEIERNQSDEQTQPETRQLHLILEKKWWPMEKFLPKAFQERNLDRKESERFSLVDHLMEQIKASANASTVISQGAAVSGLGGVGKTTTAIWFARHFADLYEHILWIDCGEKSLIFYFKALADKLKIKFNAEFDLKLLAVECFAKFENIPCLCVFDNAECYQGLQGIRDVLPKLKNMHCIITSRTTLWGSETGDGKIPQLHLNAFNTKDGVAFLKCHLKETEDISDEQLKVLSETLGNLPLALQISVTTINTKKIDFNEYIHRIQTTSDILNKSFDNYEKTINLSMKISLDLIKGHTSDHSQIAYNILLIFGYIIPYNVKLELFEAIENVSKYEVEEAVDLLEEYSLVTTTKDHLERSVSIHRLLQQVIRHNAKANKKEILRKILSCNQFSDYDNVIPYCYADEEMQKNEFPALRLKFTDGPQLKKLMEELRFTEALKLSLIIQTFSPSVTADYNYAVCLDKCGELDKAIEVLEDIYKTMLQDFDEYYEYQWDTEKMKYEWDRIKIKSTLDYLGLSLTENENVKLQEVCGLLFLLHLKIGNDETAMQIITRQNVLVTALGLKPVDHFICFLSHSSSISQYKIKTHRNRYTFKSDSWISVELNGLTSGKSLSLHCCSFSEKLPNDLQKLSLTNANFRTESGDCLSRHDITDNISTNLNKLKILTSGQKIIFDVNCIVHCMESIYLEGPQEIDFANCKWNVNEVTLVDMDILLLAKESEMKINKLILKDVTVSLTTLVNISQSVQEMKLKLVNIKKEENFLSNDQLKLTVKKLNIDHYNSYSDNGFMDWTFLVNNNLNFHAKNELILRDYNEKMTLDFSLLPSTMEKVHLERMKVSNWEISKCTINELKLSYMDISYNAEYISITKTEMKVNNLFLFQTTINSAVLFQMCQDSQQVHIKEGQIFHPSKTLQLRATQVSVDGVEFVKSYRGKIQNVIVNNIINIPNLKQLKLKSLSLLLSTYFTLEMNEAAQLDSLSLSSGVELIDFYESRWKVNEMELMYIPIEKKLKMQISKLTFSHSKIDLSCLPINLQKIYFQENCNIVCSGRLNLPQLNFVAFRDEFSMALKYFAHCSNLMTIQLTQPIFETDWEVDMKYPTNVRTIIFNRSYDKSLPWLLWYDYYSNLALTELQFLLNGFRNVDTLVFHDYPFRLLKLILSNVNTQSVTFHNKYEKISFSDLTVVAELMTKQNSKVSFKRIFWVKGNHEYFNLHEKSTPTNTNKIFFHNEVEGEVGFLDGWWAELRACK